MKGAWARIFFGYSKELCNIIECRIDIAYTLSYDCSGGDDFL